MAQGTDKVFSVIIPVFNKWELTVNCLRSLAEHTTEYTYEVVVVDNGSTDETASELQDLGQSLFGENFQRLRFEENRNFGPACNAGVRAAAAPLVFFLNNDTLLTPGWAGPLVHALAADSRLGAVGPLLLYENDRVQHLGVAFALRCASHFYRNFPKDHPVVQRPRKVQVLTGAALMMPKELFLSVGGFYKEYRNGCEDVDLCMQIGQAEKTLMCLPQSVIYHLESRTPGRKDFDKENSDLFFARCGRIIIPDLHRYAYRDGFNVTLDDYGDLAVVLSDEHEAELNSLLPTLDAQEVYDLTQQHPLWRGGLEFLADYLEKHNSLSAACDCLIQLSGVVATIPLNLRVARLAVKAGRGDLVDTIQELLKMMRSRVGNKASLLAFLKGAKGMAARHNDKLLVQIVTGFIEKIQSTP